MAPQNVNTLSHCLPVISVPIHKIRCLGSKILIADRPMGKNSDKNTENGKNVLSVHVH